MNKYWTLFKLAVIESTITMNVPFMVTLLGPLTHMW